MAPIGWTTSDTNTIIGALYDGGTSRDADPYALRHDPTPGGKGDPLAEVRGLSYDDTLRAIDEALRGDVHR